MENISVIAIGILCGISYLLWEISSTLGKINTQLNEQKIDFYKVESELKDIKFSLKRLEGEMSTIDKHSSINKIINKLEQVDTTILNSKN